ncbi:unnamed protein product [Vicia faba]|uniref:Uncharacterized protein n=1 Tax=Vicia faba TaxID=3906 RepID=A0AAV0YFM8_VICFA|nr:unnamed protein product [Vicia faba]
MIESGITDPLEFPLALDKLLGKEIAFKVKWQSLLDNCSIVSVFKDKSVIIQLKETCGDDIIFVSNPPPTPLIQEFEITSKLNPDPAMPTAKRSTLDCSS